MQQRSDWVSLNAVFLLFSMANAEEEKEESIYWALLIAIPVFQQANCFCS